MKKIGILTLHGANNMGAILQAFSLQEVIKKLGHDVEFIQLDNLGQINPIGNENYFEESKKSLKVCNEIYDYNKHKYDAIVIGSDEIWNLKNKTFNHLEEYFGYNLNTDKIISYAPSSNGVTGKDLTDFYNGKVDFSKFNNISVRDRGTQKLVRDVANIEAELVIDPTILLGNFDEYINHIQNDLKDYIVLYGYSFSESEKEKIQRFAKENNKKIYSIAYELDWCERLECDIFGFMSYIKNADYVVSNTFHGLMFSVILEKEFVIFSNNNPKVMDFIDRFNLYDRDGVNVEDLSSIFNNKADYESIKKLKKENQEKSFNYLKNAIG